MEVQQIIKPNPEIIFVPYTSGDAVVWDEFLTQAPMATFLHTRRYLSYHSDRFQDVSLLLKDSKKNKLVGLFLAAVDPNNAKGVVSHPGITYGGMLHQGNLQGMEMLQAMAAVGDYYAKVGFEVLQYKAVPHIFHRMPAGDDLYALFRLGATPYRCDLSCAIDLTNKPEASQRRKRGLKKAVKSGVQICEGVEYAEQLWEVLKDNLTRKYGVLPVHTVEEIQHLHSLFPDNIQFVVGMLNSEVLAGVVLYKSFPVAHAQYIASSAMGYQVCALDRVFEYCLDLARDESYRYFSFGVSTEKGGQYLNTGLYQFKTEFGAGGVVHEFYELRLGGLLIDNG